MIYGALLFVGACAQTGSPPGEASPKSDADSIVLPVSAKLAPDPIAPPHKDPAPRVSRCDFSKVLPSDELFEHRGYDLTGDAAVLLARDLMIPIASCASLELITVTGYTDHLGPLQNRQTLVEHRAEAIKAFLVAHGIASARVNAVGQADAPPISTGCEAQHHHKLVECLAPDRRIVVQVQGIAR